ncbi:efflux RND transporter periplasmic adaptor subunit [bacterium]|nr:efflux RND transporter periplasmic adaptor subunit [bacterium]
MRRWLRRILVLVALIAVIVALRLTLFRPEPVPVTVHEVARGRVEDTVVNSKAGTVKSRHRAEMSPGLSGLVAAIPVRKGQSVRKGDVLLRLDDAEHRANLLLAERALDAARAATEEACLAADQAGRDRRRAEDLYGRDLVSDHELETARTNDDIARAACRAARQREKQADAAVAVARATLSKTVMTAPFDGVVLDIEAEVGEWISPSPPGVFIPPVIDVIDPRALYVEAPLDEADVGRVVVGLPVRVTMDAFRDRPFAGTLTYTSSFVETTKEQNRIQTVEAEFTGGDLPANLLPGLSADVEVILDARDDVVRVPSYALLEGGRVLVVVGDELVSVDVETGLRNWEFTEIIAGLEPGDRVVVSLDRMEVRAGARVRVADEVAR